MLQRELLIKANVEHPAIDPYGSAQKRDSLIPKAKPIQKIDV